MLIFHITFYNYPLICVGGTSCKICNNGLTKLNLKATALITILVVMVVLVCNLIATYTVTLSLFSKANLEVKIELVGQKFSPRTKLRRP